MDPDAELEVWLQGVESEGVSMGAWLTELKHDFRSVSEGVEQKHKTKPQLRKIIKKKVKKTLN